MALRILLFLSMAALSGCESNRAREDKKLYDKAIRAVQKSPSKFPGVDTGKALEAVFASLTNEGFDVQPEGWTCTFYNGSFSIWYSLKVNDKPVKFHWIVEEKSVYPANELTRTITKRGDGKEGNE